MQQNQESHLSDLSQLQHCSVYRNVYPESHPDQECNSNDIKPHISDSSTNGNTIETSTNSTIHSSNCNIIHSSNSKNIDTSNSKQFNCSTNSTIYFPSSKQINCSSRKFSNSAINTSDSINKNQHAVINTPNHTAKDENTSTKLCNASTFEIIDSSTFKTALSTNLTNPASSVGHQPPLTANHVTSAERCIHYDRFRRDSYRRRDYGIPGVPREMALLHCLDNINNNNDGDPSRRENEVKRHGSWHNVLGRDCVATTPTTCLPCESRFTEATGVEDTLFDVQCLDGSKLQSSNGSNSDSLKNSKPQSLDDSSNRQSLDESNRLCIDTDSNFPGIKDSLKENNVGSLNTNPLIRESSVGVAFSLRNRVARRTLEVDTSSPPHNTNNHNTENKKYKGSLKGGGVNSTLISSQLNINLNYDNNNQSAANVLDSHNYTEFSEQSPNLVTDTKVNRASTTNNDSRRLYDTPQDSQKLRSTMQHRNRLSIASVVARLRNVSTFGKASANFKNTSWQPMTPLNSSASKQPIYFSIPSDQVDVKESLAGIKEESVHCSLNKSSNLTKKAMAHRKSIGAKMWRKLRQRNLRSIIGNKLILIGLI